MRGSGNDDDDLALRLALVDDDLRALAALDDEHADLGDRPSALLDRRMAEEFGAGALFPAACLLPDGGAGGDDDMEQMLLSESEAFLSAHFGGGATVDEMLRRLEDGGGGGVRAELTARHFLHAKHGGDALQQQRLVLLRQAIASSTAGSASAIFNMPPRYFESAASSSQKRRAHRRTFGERQQPFAFGAGCGVSNANANSFLSPHYAHFVKQEAGAVALGSGSGSGSSSVKVERHPLGTAASAGQQPLTPSPAVATPDTLVFIKEEVVTTAPALAAAFAEMDGEVADVEPMDQDEDIDMELDTTEAETEELFRAFTPVQEPAFTGFRSISDDHAALEGDADAAALRTPLRPFQSSPSGAAEQQQFTPQQSQGLASRSMSPADAFEKVAGVVQVARDSPARLGKFEWRVNGTDASPGAAQRKQSAGTRKRPSLAAQLGSADAAAASELIASASSDLGDDGATSASTLPPRYFRGGTSSPQKRRAHSTTFGSFARSFSFTGAAPSDV